MLYSQKSIAIATFIGGPIASGILIRRNFINLGNELYGLYAILFSVLFLFAIFGSLFLFPEEIFDSIPNAIFPSIYTALIYLVAEFYQGAQIKKHKAEGGEFYSNWRAAGIGALFMAIFVVVFIAYDLLAPEPFDTQKYDEKMDKIFKYEKSALELFELIEYSNESEIIKFIDKKGIPSWKMCLKMLDEMDQIEGLTDEFKSQNIKLREYTELRIRSYEIMRKGVKENTDKYQGELLDINRKIESVLE